MSNTVESVSFQTKPEVNEDELLTAIYESQNYAKSQPGFISRTTLFDEKSNLWTEIVTWDSLPNAMAAADNFAQSQCTQKLMSLIDPQTIQMSHHRVKLNFV